MSARIARRAAAVLAAAAATLTLGAGAASAYEPCPAPYSSVNTGGDLPGVEMFCRAEPNPPFGIIPLYVVKVPAASLTQGFEFLSPGEQDAQPTLKFRSVRSFFERRIEDGERWSLMMNGTFWDPYPEDSSIGRTAFPFFTYNPEALAPSLVSIGKDPRYEGANAGRRRCVSWQHDRSRVRDGAWTLGSAEYDYWDIRNWLETPGATCNVVGADGTTDRGEFVVAFDPYLEIDEDDRGGPNNALMIMGVETSGPANFNNDTICFYIGGWQTRAAAANRLLNTFGCKPILQLDGGNSTQFGYYNEEAGRVEMLVKGGAVLSNRAVPHYMMVR